MPEKQTPEEDLTGTSRDPAIIERAGGDPRLIDRYVGLAHTERLLAENPDSVARQTMIEIAQADIARIRQELGMPPELPPTA
jgi:hypothetical protein